MRRHPWGQCGRTNSLFRPPYTSGTRVVTFQNLVYTVNIFVGKFSFRRLRVAFIPGFIWPNILESGQLPCSAAYLDWQGIRNLTQVQNLRKISIQCLYIVCIQDRKLQLLDCTQHFGTVDQLKNVGRSDWRTDPIGPVWMADFSQLIDRIVTYSRETEVFVSDLSCWQMGLWTISWFPILHGATVPSCLIHPHGILPGRKWAKTIL
jgi:hypothetical protein